MRLSEREIQVLTTIVEHYVQTAVPAGSRTVSRKSGLNLSAASIRNTMADLTELGFLEQPHTSAGRVPTALAFRFYLDTVLGAPMLGEPEQRLIREHLGSAGLELSDLLRRSSRLLSGFSNQISMVLAPAHEDVRWRRIEFVAVSPGLVMAILILQGGLLQNRLIKVEQEITPDDLVRFGNYLNHFFTGKTLTEVRLQVLRELSGARERMDLIYRRALSLARSAFEAESEREVFIEGTTSVLIRPEFTDIENMRDLLRLLEDRSRLLELLDRTIEGGRIRITLGQEVQMEELRDYGLVSSPYGEEGRGVLGVIGPLRMDYAKVVPLVDFTARMLTELLKKRS
jgi:heat-inducible transcriptional repressor